MPRCARIRFCRDGAHAALRRDEAHDARYATRAAQRAADFQPMLMLRRCLPLTIFLIFISRHAIACRRLSFFRHYVILHVFTLLPMII
jgi:hypothetical protein